MPTALLSLNMGHQPDLMCNEASDKAVTISFASCCSAALLTYKIKQLTGHFYH